METCAIDVQASQAISDTLHPTVTTSSVLAVVYKDGVMMAADTLASYGRTSRFKQIDRYCAINQKTLVCTSGDYSDHQKLSTQLISMCETDALHLDGVQMSPKSIAAITSRILYQKRSKMNPLWLSVLVAGAKSHELSIHSTGEETSKPYLGYVDMVGTFFEEDFVATGLGRYFAITLMRQKHRTDMTEEEARALLEECMLILFYRDCAASNRVQIAKVTEEGVTIEEPKTIKSEWNIAGYADKTMDMSLAGCSW